MSKPGPKRLPLAILKLRGSRHVANRKDEPQPDISIPAMPTFLNAPAKTEWKRLTKLLVNQQVLAETDRAALAMYCQSWGEYVALITEFNKNPEYVLDDGRKNPVMFLMDRACMRVAKLSAEFGLTPSSRGNVNPAAQDNVSGKSRFFDKR